MAFQVVHSSSADTCFALQLPTMTKLCRPLFLYCWAGCVGQGFSISVAVVSVTGDTPLRWCGLESSMMQFMEKHCKFGCTLDLCGTACFRAHNHCFSVVETLHHLYSCSRTVLVCTHAALFCTSCLKHVHCLCFGGQLFS